VFEGNGGCLPNVNGGLSSAEVVGRDMSEPAGLRPYTGEWYGPGGGEGSSPSYELPIDEFREEGE
jgi:hypothetical protein